MKINWKVAIACVLVIVTVIWMFDSVRSRSYTGGNLKFSVGSGTVAITNPADEPVAVQLTGTGTRSFSVSSTIEGVSGTSTKQGTGSKTTQLFEFGLPPGISEFTVTRGTNVSFGANGSANLSATVQPSSATERNTTIMIAAVVILGALFYMSRTTGHRWIATLRGQKIPTAVPVAESPSSGQGRVIRAYGDNRKDLS